MCSLRFIEHERSIGLIGAYASGKTVFLTSLINHIHHHSSVRFHLRTENAQIRKFKSIDSDSGWTAFDYLGARDTMLYERKWPVKTTDRSQFICTFERSDWKFGRAKLKLFDLPGERIADASMARLDFAAWSDHMIRLIRSDTGYRQHAEEYLSAIDHALPEADIVRFYKLALARLIHAYTETMGWRNELRHSISLSVAVNDEGKA
jgi:uncharacterized protein